MSARTKKRMSVKEAATALGIARSTLYGHLSDFECIYGEDHGVFETVGGRKLITRMNMKRLKKLLSCPKTTSIYSGTERPGEPKVMSLEKEYGAALKYAQRLKNNSLKKL
jgi:hypothetical protein